MKKEKQIEEIFNIIVDGVIDGDDNNGVPTGNTCVNIAKDIYNAGYQKAYEYKDKIERLKAKNEKLLNAIEDFTAKKCCLKCEIAKTLVKEFAEKVKQAIVDNTYPYFDKNGKPVNIWNTDGFDRIDELLKEYEK